MFVMFPGAVNTRQHVINYMCINIRYYKDKVQAVVCCGTFMFVHLCGFAHLSCAHLCAIICVASMIYSCVCVCVCLDSTRPHAPIISNRWADKMPEKQLLPAIKPAGCSVSKGLPGLNKHSTVHLNKLPLILFLRRLTKRKQ